MRRGLGWRSALAIHVAVMLMITCTPSAEAADPATVAGLLAGAKQIIAQLQSVAATLTGDANVPVNNAIMQLNQLLTRLDQLTKHNIADPIHGLSGDARTLATQLQQALESYSPLIDRHRDCLFQDLGQFLAALNTVTANAKQGIPTVDAGQPRLVSFQFDSRTASNVVPLEGGRMVIRGYKLWVDEAPEVAIYNDRRNAGLAKLTAGRAADQDSVSVVVPDSVLRDQAGKCLQLNVKTFEKKHLWFIPTGRDQTGDFFIPMCVPEQYAMQLKLNAWISYSVTNPTGRRQLAAKIFGWGNDSCESRRDVPPQTQSWAGVILPGWKIVGYTEASSDVRYTTNISVTWTDTTITAAGWLDTARCAWLLFGRSKLLSDTHWYKSLAPIIVGPVTDSFTTPAASPASKVVTMQVPSTSVCVDVPKSAEASGDSTYWLTLVPIIRGAEAKALYDQPRKTTSKDAFSYVTSIGHYRVETTYNPTVAGGACQVCATLSAQNRCSY